MNRHPVPLAVVAGASAGLGLVIARMLLARGHDVVIVGRDESRLETARRSLASEFGDRRVTAIPADLTSADRVADLADRCRSLGPPVAALVNVAGGSDRGLAEELTPQRLHELLDQNVTTALLCSQAFLPMLRESRGVIVNVGSLASKVGARYLGGYPAAKHALAGLTQQMRLELRPCGVHVALVSPGPIRRGDAGTRYADRVSDELPDQATAPGGGTRVKGISPERVAAAVVRCIERRAPDVILPGYLRLLVAIGHALPRLGDWLLMKFTSPK